MKGRADNLFQSKPVLTKMNTALESCDLEQITQKAIEPIQFVGDAFKKLIACSLVQRVPVATQSGDAEWRCRVATRG